MENPTYDPVYDEEQQMNLMEFFNKYKKNIRQLVIITEGYCGLTNYDDLTNDQILRVVTYTKQRRLVAKENKVKQRRKTSYLSIPVDVPYMFTVVRGHNKVDEPAKLSDIIKKHRYPIMIKFADPYSDIKVGEVTENTSSFASLLLIKEYEENFLSFHCVYKGEITERITLSALSPNISCTLITGEKSMDRKKFQEHLAKMDRKIAHIKHNRTCGRPEITRITDEGTGTGNPIPDLDPPLIPTDYSQEDSGPPPRVPKRHRSQEFKISPDDDSNYEPPPIPVDCFKETYRPPRPRKLLPAVPQLHNSNQSILLPVRKGYENTTIAVPPMSKIPESCSVVGTEPTMTQDEYLCEGIYDELVECDLNVDSKSDDSGLSGTKSNESSVESPQREWLDNLSVSGVSDILKRLRLHNYVKKFQKDIVSGSILGEFDEDLLKEEYKFSRIETIRLMKFVRTGHIPI